MAASAAPASSPPDGPRALACGLLAAVAVAGLLAPRGRSGPILGVGGALGYAAGAAALGAEAGQVGLGAVVLALTGPLAGGVAARLAAEPRPDPAGADAAPEAPPDDAPAPLRVVGPGALRLALASEIARARRYEHTLSLLLVGVEEWPALAAEHGLEGAARRVAELAELVRRVVRDVDTVSVYGDGLLALLLPETGLDGAAVVAGKVERVARERAGLTIRAGAASYPDDALTAEELRREADAALDLARLARRSIVNRARLD